MGHVVRTHLLVDPDAERVEFVFDNLLVRNRFARVQHNKDEIARARRRNNLLAPTATVGGAFDNAGQVSAKKKEEKKQHIPTFVV
jgi:hypothetical protein